MVVKSKSTERYRQIRHLGATKRLNPQWGRYKHTVRCGREAFAHARDHA